ncbi:MAG: O-antigen translocase, partial [Bacteroidales bacterium]|nr:O-antigen translocase [Bacteroidales bacterium]
MSEQQSSYRQIIKATSLFGGVQVFNILIQIIRSKVIAILLGPSGMGIIGLLNSTTTFISSLTNFGLGTSAVKNVSEANFSRNTERISSIVTVLRRLVWITGLLGTIFTIIFSKWLSQITFGNEKYTSAFIWISVSLLFNQLSSGQMVIIQGMRKLKLLAKANLSGSTLGLFVTLPLYFFMGLDGIIPGIIGTSLISMLVSFFYSRKIPVVPAQISVSKTLKEGKSMLQMGFLISLSGLLTLGASYILRIFIGRIGGTAEVGLYTAGFAIINSYVGLIFNAMGTDYYPRLSAIANDNKKCAETISQQSEIGILILAPIIVAFLIFIKWVIIILYSNQFISVSGMIYWASFGMFFKVVSWAIAFVFLAKGASKLFFWNELISGIYILILNLLGYHYMGLTGLGISFAVGYLIYLFQVYTVSRIQYGFSLNRDF